MSHFPASAIKVLKWLHQFVHIGLNMLYEERELADNTERGHCSLHFDT